MACDWNETFNIPVQTPIMASSLRVQVLDKEDLAKDELAATMVFKYADLAAMDGKMFWKDLYGSPGQEAILSTNNTTQANRMNNDPDIASLWKGRILMSVEYKDEEKPKYSVEDIHNDDLKERAH